MVAKIASGKSIRGILKYNENKVGAGEAELIMAGGFAGEIDCMGLEEKLGRFRRLTELNGKVKTNAMHISLNFHPDEKLSDEKLQRIAAAYMERIGFGEQPFLVYRHFDSAHTHIHIATTNIRRDGSRIDINKIGYRLSEPARKAIELEFELVRADGKSPVIREAIALGAYGDRPTRQVIGNLVTRVMQEYAFSSFGDFRTLMEHFGILADRGEKGSRMFERKGLQFFLMGRDGKAMGVPVKASAIHAKPTMENLEKRFEKNKSKKDVLKAMVRAKLDSVLSPGQMASMSAFTRSLKQQNIETVSRRNTDGKLYGLTFIDLERRVVFNGSELGKGYSAKAVEARLHVLNLKNGAGEYIQLAEKRFTSLPDAENQGERAMRPIAMLEVLTQKEFTGSVSLAAKRKKRRKKVRHGQDLSR